MREFRAGPVVLCNSADFLERPQCEISVDRFDLLAPERTLIIECKCERPFDDGQIYCPWSRCILAPERAHIEDVVHDLHVYIDPLEISRVESVPVADRFSNAC